MNTDAQAAQSKCLTTKVTAAALARALTDAALADRLARIADDVRAFSSPMRAAFVCEAAARLRAR